MHLAQLTDIKIETDILYIENRKTFTLTGYHI